MHGWKGDCLVLFIYAAHTRTKSSSVSNKPHHCISVCQLHFYTFIHWNKSKNGNCKPTINDNLNCGASFFCCHVTKNTSFSEQIHCRYVSLSYNIVSTYFPLIPKIIIWFSTCCMSKKIIGIISWLNVLWHWFYPLLLFWHLFGACMFTTVFNYR